MIIRNLRALNLKGSISAWTFDLPVVDVTTRFEHFPSEVTFNLKEVLNRRESYG